MSSDISCAHIKKCVHNLATCLIVTLHRCVMQGRHGAARCMHCDRERSVLVVAGDGASIHDAAGVAVPPPTVSVWSLPGCSLKSSAEANAWPSLLGSLGRPRRRNWLLRNLGAPAERYCGWSIAVSPDGRCLAVNQPGAPLCIIRCHVRSLCPTHDSCCQFQAY